MKTINQNLEPKEPLMTEVERYKMMELTSATIFLEADAVEKQMMNIYSSESSIKGFEEYLKSTKSGDTQASEAAIKHAKEGIKEHKKRIDRAKEDLKKSLLVINETTARIEEICL